LPIFAAIRRASLYFPRLRFLRSFPPFPFAGLRVVAGSTALDHFVAPILVRHDEGGEVAAAKAKRAERHHDDELQLLAHGPTPLKSSTAAGKRRESI
jgi:hypothetical protein